MNRHHKFILDAIRDTTSDFDAADRQAVQLQYHGNDHHYYGLRNPQMQAIVDAWHIENKQLNDTEVLKLITSLIHGRSYEEKLIGPRILKKRRTLRRTLDLTHLDDWLNRLEGWAEIDNCCQNIFEHHDYAAQPNAWVQLLKKLNESKNINKRRASLVLMIPFVRKLDDSVLRQLAFRQIVTVSSERDILITKAVSWLLREMTKMQANDVITFIDKHESNLPPIATRETRRKIKTGKKNG